MRKSILIRKRRKTKGFNPNHEYVQKAQDEFFQRGGKVTFLKPKNVELEELLKQSEKNAYADEFLLEGDLPKSIGVGAGIY